MEGSPCFSQVHAKYFPPCRMGAYPATHPPTLFRAHACWRHAGAACCMPPAHRRVPSKMACVPVSDMNVSSPRLKSESVR